MTESIGQLKALQQLDISIQLKKNTARSVNFTFGTGSTTLIKSDNLDTPLRLIIFHIVSVNTPFLLYVANIDKHKVFFNNIINQVIQ